MLARLVARHGLALTMMGTVGLVVVVAVLDQQREATAVIESNLDEQALLTRAVGADVQRRLQSWSRASGGRSAEELSASDRLVAERLLGGVRALEAVGQSLIFVARPNTQAFVSTEGGVVASTRVSKAVAEGVTRLTIPRDEAPAFGLPRRLALATTVPIDEHGKTWIVLVVSSAQRERDRQRRATARLTVGVLMVVAVVVGFGSVGLRKTKKELTLARTLELRELARERDEYLARADKMATIATIAGGIAHELATPLGIIVSRTEQLQRQVHEDEKGARAARTILEQAERIERVVRGFLGLARGEAPNIEPLRPRHLASAAVGLVRHRFSATGVSLDVDAQAPLPSVAGNAALIEHAIVNLLLNACDASPAGSRVVLCLTQAEQRVAFTVLDEGPGVAADALDVATRPFYTTKPSGKGTGLGLAIVNEIVRHYGGVLELGPRGDGRPGTRASFSLPASEESA
jgi:signal transduction histidine kinase